MARQKFTGAAGLALPRRAVRILKERGIFAHPLLSVEHQASSTTLCVARLGVRRVLWQM